MKEISTRDTMTVKEVSDALGVDERSIRRYAEKLRTELSGVKNSQGGHVFTEIVWK